MNEKDKIRELLFSKNCVTMCNEINSETMKKIKDETIEKVRAFIENCTPLLERNILFYISGCPGGTPSAGWELKDFVEQVKKMNVTVYTLVGDRVASMGAVLACILAPEGNRYIFPHGEMLIHQVLGQLSGQFADIKKQFKYMSDTNKTIMEALTESTNMSIEEIEAACDRDTTYNAEEAVRLGLADHILN